MNKVLNSILIFCYSTTKIRIYSDIDLEVYNIESSKVTHSYLSATEEYYKLLKIKFIMHIINT